MENEKEKQEKQQIEDEIIDKIAKQNENKQDKTFFEEVEEYLEEIENLDSEEILKEKEELEELEDYPEPPTIYELEGDKQEKVIQNKKEKEKKEEIEKEKEEEKEKEIDKNGELQTQQEELHQENKKYKFKLKLYGEEKDFEFDEDEIKKILQKGLDYTFKTQQLSKYRKIINDLEQNNITEEDLSILKDLKQNNIKNALEKIAVKYGLEPIIDNTLKLNEEDIKQQQIQQQSKQQQNVFNPHPEIMQKINILDSYSEIDSNIKQVRDKIVDFLLFVDDSVRKTFLSNPQLFNVVEQEVINGHWDKIKPELIKKLSVLDDYQRILYLTNVQNFINLYNETYLKLFGEEQFQKNSSQSDGIVEGNQKTSTIPIKQKQKLNPSILTDKTIRKRQVLNDLEDSEEIARKILEDDKFYEQLRQKYETR